MATRERRALSRYIASGLTIKEIAAEEGVATNTVWTWLMRWPCAITVSEQRRAARGEQNLLRSVGAMRERFGR